MTVAVASRPQARPSESVATGATPIRRRFLQVGARRVHYLRAGSGPPVVLVHSSPANAWLLRPEIERLAREFSVFTFDTPGFGLSEPLPSQALEVRDLADALAETLQTIGMPACPMFGSHTGAAIALEFGVRHPERITGLVLDGVPAFTEAEHAELFGDYFRKFPVSDLGSQYAMVWTRFRDQSVWFPWSTRRPAHLNAYDLGAPASTHMWASMYFEAADTYTPAYRAALRYCGRALVAAAELERPAIYTATDTDMLFPHMQRLPPLKPGQEIRRIGTSYEAKRELIAEGFARFGSAGAAPPDAEALGSGPLVSGPGLARQFLDRAGGGQTHVRYAGRRDAPALLLLHDAPGSAAQLEPLIAALATRWFVVAPDLPGCGESDALETPLEMADCVAVLTQVLDRFGVERTEVYGVGFGASAAVALACTAPGRVARLAVQGLLAPTPEARAELKAGYAPPIPIEADGAHWYRTWLMLRDSLVWWPWYARKKTAQRATPGDFDADRLHRWTVDVMRQRERYGDFIRAALDHDAPAALMQVACPVVRLVGGATPLCAYDDAVRGRVPATPEAVAERDAHRHAETLWTLGAPRQ